MDIGGIHERIFYSILLRPIDVPLCSHMDTVILSACAHTDNSVNP